MVCEFMLIPKRDGAELDSPLDLLPLPNGVWDGKIAYLDRDGVLNIGSENYINSPEELVVFPNTADSVAALRESGFRVCVVTNQSPIGRGLWSDETLHSIHAKLRELLLSENSNAHLDLILYSPYAPWEGAWARKPNPGMLEASRQIISASEKNIDINLRFDNDWKDTHDESKSVMVGDRDVDMRAAFNFGVKGIRCNPEIGIYDVISEILGD
jgi:D-glycero-D-manno-heptose 1,7-bisphosphate phosphatase